MGKLEDKYLLRCKNCGHEFFPWKALMVTSDRTNWKPYLFCPNCHKFEDKENFKIN